MVFEFSFNHTALSVAGDPKNQIIMKKNHESKSNAKATTANSFNQFKKLEISKVKQKCLKGGDDIIIDDVVHL